MLNVDIVLFDGFDELDAIGPHEVLRNAGGGVRVRLVSVDGPREVTANHGLRIWTEGKLDASTAPDVLIVPGGGWVARKPQGVRAEIERGAIPAALREFHASGTVIASVCTGAMLLAAAGLVRGRPATTHHAAVEDLRAAGGEVFYQRVVDDEDLVTSGGVTSGLDLALWLVERWLGSDAARGVEAMLEYRRRGEVRRRTAQPSGETVLSEAAIR